MVCVFTNFAVITSKIEMAENLCILIRTGKEIIGACYFLCEANCGEFLGGWEKVHTRSTRNHRATKPHKLVSLDLLVVMLMLMLCYAMSLLSPLAMLMPVFMLKTSQMSNVVYISRHSTSWSLANPRL